MILTDVFIDTLGHGAPALVYHDPDTDFIYTAVYKDGAIAAYDSAGAYVTTDVPHEVATRFLGSGFTSDVHELLQDFAHLTDTEQQEFRRILGRM